MYIKKKKKRQINGHGGSNKNLLEFGRDMSR